MKVLLVNTYHYLRGGDCRHVFGLERLLRNMGHQVHFFSMKSQANKYCRDSEFFIEHIDYREAIKNGGLLNAVNVVRNSIFSREAKIKIGELLEHVKPDIAHLHSIRHHITKSVLPELAKRNIPVVWTLHDYKELCPNTSFFNGRAICEQCKNKKYHHVILNRCKKNSLPASIITYVEALINGRSKYENLVDLYISPSHFLRQKFLEYGYAEEKIRHLPNFIEMDLFQPRFTYDNYLLFLGRLEREKGIETLIRAFLKTKGCTTLGLKIAGTGTLENSLKKIVDQSGHTNIEFLGFLRGEDLANVTMNAKAIVIPSEWHENYPFSALEAMAYGKPIIASRVGGLPEIIEDNETGLLYEPCNESQLLEKILQMNSFTEKDIEVMGRKARKKVEQVNNESDYLFHILKIYSGLMQNKKN